MKTLKEKQEQVKHLDSQLNLFTRLFTEIAYLMNKKHQPCSLCKSFQIMQLDELLVS